MDWIAVKQLVPAGVIKQNGQQVSNLGATTLCQGQASKPRFNLYCSDLSQFVVSPVWTDPSVQICLIGFLRCVTAPGIVLCEFPLLKVIAEMCDRNRASMNPRLLRIDLCQQDCDSRTGSSFVWIAINGANYPLPLDTRSTQPFSDQRNCQTAGPSLRLTIARLPRCIVILLRHGLAQENLQALGVKRGCRAQSE